MRRTLVLVATLAMVAAARPGAALGRDGLALRGPRSDIGAIANMRPRGAPRSGDECLTHTPGVGNMLLDCHADASYPTNTPVVAADPADPTHVVIGAMDPLSGSYGTNEFYATFDGGRSWLNGDVPFAPGLNSQGDPALTIDVRHGAIIYGSESAFVTPAFDVCTISTDVTVSTDGGRHWGQPVIVGPGQGCTTGPSVGYGAEWMATDNNATSPYFGRTYLTVDENICLTPECNQATDGSTRFLVESHSDDGGLTWTAPRRISGSSSEFCTAYLHAPSCGMGLASFPVVSPDGSVHVGFQDVTHQAAWEPGECCESQWMVVGSNDGGDTWTDPVHVIDAEDGSRDLPDAFIGFGAFSIGLLTGTQIGAVPALGALAASPIDGTLYVVFGDNRNGVHDSDSPETNLDVFVMTSTDGGQTWTGPDVVTDAPGDQWLSFAAVNPVSGELAVEFLDRGYDQTGQSFDLTLAAGHPGAFSYRRITTRPSPLQNNLWFPAGVPGCETCASWVGEYMSFAFGPDETADLAWTDLRRTVHVQGVGTGQTENIFSARV
jgi:hypothetical protein